MPPSFKPFRLSHYTLRIPHYTAVILVVGAAGCASSGAVLAVNAPVVDLRAEPHTVLEPGRQDLQQETQLVYGERVRLRAQADGWAHVEALEQPEFTHARRWQGYPGWVPLTSLVPWEPLREPTVVVTEKWVEASEDPQILAPTRWRFPLGTRLRATEMGGHVWMVELLDGSVAWIPFRAARALEELRALPALERRRLVLRNAGLLLGDPYVWGGRSPSGIDCSGLVNLAYRAAGVDIPRDAHEQFLRAKPVSAVQPGDLIFLSERGNPQRIVHVMLYAGEGAVIEGPGTGLAVRRLAVTERLGQPLDWLAPGSVVDDQILSFGSYLP